MEFWVSFFICENFQAWCFGLLLKSYDYMIKFTIFL